MRITSRWLVAVLMAVLLVACGGSTPEEPSDGCSDLMRRAADAPLVADQEVQPLVESLTTCGTADVWLDALRGEPGAMGMSDPAAIGDLDLQVACHGHEETPVCRDAAV